MAAIGLFILVAFVLACKSEYDRRNCKAGNHHWINPSPHKLECKHCKVSTGYVPFV